MDPAGGIVGIAVSWLEQTVRTDLLVGLAGFDPVERLDLRPFPDAERLPEIDLEKVPEEQKQLADKVNRLRDRIDELLFGYQDFGMVGRRPARNLKL